MNDFLNRVATEHKNDTVVRFARTLQLSETGWEPETAEQETNLARAREFEASLRRDGKVLDVDDQGAPFIREA